MSGHGIYGQMVDAGVEIASHESDLYVKVTPESEAIINTYEHKANVRRFVSAIDGTQWFDIPFAFIPWWDKRRS